MAVINTAEFYTVSPVVRENKPPVVLQKEVVYKKKESIFSLEESEFRQPAVMTLQVWDYDRIASNDFLGETNRQTGL